MNRFSRDKRFRKVGFEEFLRSAQALQNLAKGQYPEASVEVFTCEDSHTYNFSTVTIVTDEVLDALKRRKPYTLDQLTKDVWESSYKVNLCIRNMGDLSMISLTCDRVAKPRRMCFYFQCIPENLSAEIQRVFQKPNFFWKIGDGHSKLSDFNSVYSRIVTRISV